MTKLFTDWSSFASKVLTTPPQTLLDDTTARASGITEPQMSSTVTASLPGAMLVAELMLLTKFIDILVSIA